MKLQVRGVETFATTGGRPFVPEQPTIVFVHGAGMNRIVWYLQTRYFAHHGHAVLAVDLPGHGRSQGTLLGSVQELADWIPDLLDSAGVAKATLVGHSMGSLIALESAARHPDRVSKLALLGAASKMPVHPDLLEAANADDPLAYDLMMDWGTGPVGHFGRHPVPGISAQTKQVGLFGIEQYHDARVVCSRLLLLIIIDIILIIFGIRGSFILPVLIRDVLVVLCDRLNRLG